MPELGKLVSPRREFSLNKMWENMEKASITRNVDAMDSLITVVPHAMLDSSNTSVTQVLGKSWVPHCSHHPMPCKSLSIPMWLHVYAWSMTSFPTLVPQG